MTAQPFFEYASTVRIGPAAGQGSSVTNLAHAVVDSDATKVIRSELPPKPAPYVMVKVLGASLVSPYLTRVIWTERYVDAGGRRSGLVRYDALVSFHISSTWLPAGVDLAAASRPPVADRERDRLSGALGLRFAQDPAGLVVSSIALNDGRALH